MAYLDMAWPLLDDQQLKAPLYHQQTDTSAALALKRSYGDQIKIEWCEKLRVPATQSAHRQPGEPDTK
ncbi:hypothetical protein N7475_007021 [Penicillium sp. IBT 31633x]|nr:hypothetical protein N7475_007021 [Penicillium sp. IBT 31633x]